MHKAELDIPVAIIFFIRPEALNKVFEKVKKARPSKLFLIQDGARTNSINDNQLVKQCREIVDEIDWECAVYKNYSDVNLGCGLRPYSGISWVFDHVDRAIILEDDCIPADSFFNFCKEMLNKYENDQRVGIISGLNHFGEYDFGGYSYGFVKSAGIWGWATWRDRWLKYSVDDYELNKFKEDYIKQRLILDITPRFAARERIKIWEKAKKEIDSKVNVSYWDHQWSFIRHINSWVAIVPKYNQITNVGIGKESTHSANSIKLLPKKIAKFFFMDTKEIEFPLKHPSFLLPNRDYDKKYYSIVFPGELIVLFRRIRRVFLEIIYRLLRKK